MKTRKPAEFGTRFWVNDKLFVRLWSYQSQVRPISNREQTWFDLTPYHPLGRNKVPISLERHELGDLEQAMVDTLWVAGKGKEIER